MEKAHEMGWGNTYRPVKAPTFLPLYLLHLQRLLGVGIHISGIKGT